MSAGFSTNIQPFSSESLSLHCDHGNSSLFERRYRVVHGEYSWNMSSGDVNKSKRGEVDIGWLCAIIRMIWNTYRYIDDWNGGDKQELGRESGTRRAGRRLN